MIMKRTAILLAVACLMGGCGIYGRYSRPDIDVEVDSLYRVPAAAADTSAAASLPWRELFTDPELQALIDTGLANNADLAVARLQVEEAQAALANARLSYLPSLSLTPQAGVGSYDGGTQRTYIWVRLLHGNRIFSEKRRTPGEVRLRSSNSGRHTARLCRLSWWRP